MPGAREMAQQLRALGPLPQDPGLSPSTHMAAHNQLELQFQGIQHLHIDIHSSETPMNIKK